MKTDSLLQQLVTRTNALPDAAGIRALLSYSGTPERSPVEKITLAFMTSENYTTHFNDENMECCRKMIIEVSMNCYAPKNMALIDVVSKVETVLDELYDSYAGEMKTYRLGKAKLDDDTKTLKIPCKLIFEYETCVAYSTESSVLRPYADFLCKTHVEDATMHLTSDEKSFVIMPFVTGRYTGTGEETHEISLGESPKAIFVFEITNALISRAESGDNIYCNFAFRSGGGNSMGIYRTDDGFGVRRAEANGTVTFLNEALHNYAYIYLRK